jgi:hypothetical protein
MGLLVLQSGTAEPFAFLAGDRTVEWFELQSMSACYGPAFYRLRLVNSNGQPIPIPSLTGATRTVS